MLLSIQLIFVEPRITNLPQRALQSVHIRHPLSQDLTSDQEEIEETFRRATEEDPSPGWTEQ